MQNLVEKVELTDELRARKILIRVAWHFVRQMEEAQEELRNAGEMHSIDGDFNIWHASSTMGGLEVNTLRPKTYIKRV